MNATSTEMATSFFGGLGLSLEILGSPCLFAEAMRHAFQFKFGVWCASQMRVVQAAASPTLMGLGFRVSCGSQEGTYNPAALGCFQP